MRVTSILRTHQASIAIEDVMETAGELSGYVNDNSMWEVGNERN